MKIHLEPLAIANYGELSLQLQKAVDKQFAMLKGNLRHPSLRAKKCNENTGEWQARVNDDYRFYFYIEGDTYAIVKIIKHPK